MKNLTLFLLLLGLGIFTYELEEKGDRENREREKKKHQLIDPKIMGSLLSFKTAQASLLFSDGEIFSEKTKEKMDGPRVQDFFNRLQSLRVEKTIEREHIEKLGDHHFFPENPHHYFSFGFEGGEVDFILGKKLDFDETFYMKVVSKTEGERYLVVRDTGPREGLYFQEDEHRSALAYMKLKDMMGKNDSFFKPVTKNQESK